MSYKNTMGVIVVIEIVFLVLGIISIVMLSGLISLAGSASITHRSMFDAIIFYMSLCMFPFFVLSVWLIWSGKREGSKSRLRIWIYLEAVLLIFEVASTVYYFVKPEPQFITGIFSTFGKFYRLWTIYVVWNYIKELEEQPVQQFPNQQIMYQPSVQQSMNPSMNAMTPPPPYAPYPQQPIITNQQNNPQAFQIQNEPNYNKPPQ